MVTFKLLAYLLLKPFQLIKIIFLILNDSWFLHHLIWSSFFLKEIYSLSPLRLHQIQSGYLITLNNHRIKSKAIVNFIFCLTGKTLNNWTHTSIWCYKICQNTFRRIIGLSKFWFVESPYIPISRSIKLRICLTGCQLRQKWQPV